jgi:hypothetical protein
MAWCEANGVDFVLGLAKSSRLLAMCLSARVQAQLTYLDSGEASRVFDEFSYRTRDSWSQERRVIVKAEHLAKGANPRFVVTTLGAEQADARALYEDLYCARGDRQKTVSKSNSSTCLPTAPAPTPGMPTSCGCTSAPLPTSLCAPCVVSG